MILALLGCALACIGLAALFAAWRLKRRTPLLTWAGWVLIGAGAAAWSRAQGAEFGISFTLITLALAAWAVTIGNQDSRRQKVKPQIRTPLQWANARQVGLQLWRVFTVVLLSGLVSVALLVALAKLLPLSTVNAMVLAALVSPVVWGAAAYWLLADPRPLRPPVSLLVAGLVSGVIIML